MSIEKVYYASQILSSIAVVASLIYLATQTRQNSKNQLAMMHQNRSLYIREILFKIADPHFTATWRAGAIGDPRMEISECDKFCAFARATFLGSEETFRQFREGLIDPKRWAGTKENIKGVLTYPGYRAMYKLLRPRLDEGYVGVVDSLLDEVKGQPTSDPNLAWKLLAAEERNAMLTPS